MAWIVANFDGLVFAVVIGVLIGLVIRRAREG